MSNIKFRVSNRKFKAFLIVAFAVFFMILLYFTTQSYFNTASAVCFIVSLCVACGTGLIVSLFIKEIYFQIYEDRFEVIKGSKVTSYSYTEFVSTDVTRHYVNGIYLGTSRVIFLQKPGEKKEVINAGHLNRETFSELISYIGRNKFEEEAGTEDYSDFFKEEKVFVIPTDTVIRENEKKMNSQLILEVILAVVSCGIWLFKIAANNDSVILTVIGLLTGVAVVIYGIMDFIPAIIAYVGVRSIPKKVTVKDDTLTVGEDSFTPENIMCISMVPASYEILLRDLIIITVDGKKYIYNFGKKEMSGKLTYAEYEDLNAVIRLWSLGKRVNFKSVLG